MTMKILSWVHRKLHLNTNYSQVSQKNGVVTDAFVGDEVKSASPKKALEQDSEALLLEDVLHGILTIGTLGHNHAFADHTNCTTDKEEEDEPALEEVVIQADEKEATSDHAAVGAVGGAGRQHPLRVVELSTIKARISLEEKSVAVAAPAPVVPETEEILELDELPLLMEDKEKLERRTTLADLFAAEPINESSAADLVEKVPSANYVRINSTSGQQQGAADQKKLMKQRKKIKGEQKLSSTAAPSTSKKFHKLITRVLKKKIHPADMAPAAAAAKDQDAARERSCPDQKPRHGPVRAPWLLQNVLADCMPSCRKINEKSLMIISMKHWIQYDNYRKLFMISKCCTICRNLTGRANKI